ncbi:NCS1 nucleoside transporter [Xylariales sp. PMI_506]|nr:NCS1 nucleoside transporter [Xylariales sp. PMI_506]
MGTPHNNRSHLGVVSLLTVEPGVVYKPAPEKNPRWYQRLLDAGVEDNGIKPVPVERRTNTSYNNLFSVFFTALLCVLPIPTGMLATLVYGMKLRDASLAILFFSMLCCIPPAFMGCGGHKTGMRQLIQARYSWDLYVVTIPLLLNAATVTGFSLIAAIVGGQTIAAINPGNVSVNVGIAITIVVSFCVSLLGFRALHSWERWSWIPNLVAILVTVGCGAKNLHHQVEAQPATASQIVSYGGLIAGYFITFGGTVSDYAIYHSPNASKIRVFTYIYLGLLTPSVPLFILDAAMGGVVSIVDGWSDSYDAFGAGGILAEMVAPAGGFGKFILVLLALSVLGNIAISMYSVALNLQMILPLFTKIPRYVFIVVVVALMIPVAIKAAQEWEESLENFLALISYWAGCFDAVLIEELIIFRKMDFSTFDQSIWNVGSKLPSGIPALAASICSMGLVVPGMAEVWYTGPVAGTTGDIGFEMAFFITALFYLPFRWIEIKWRKHI